MSNLIARRLHHLALLALAALIVGQLGSLHWFAELFSHFLPYYALAFLGAACVLRGYKRLFWIALTLLATLWLLQPFALWRQAAAPTTHRLIWYNVHLDNRHAANESAHLLSANADILALGEINLADSGWQTLRDHYPHGCEHREYSPFALALWSREALANCDIRDAGGYPYIRAEQQNGTVIYALHPPPPITAQLAQARIHYLQQTAAHIALDNQVIVVGDLNATPFSPLMRRFMRESNTQTTTPYFTPTWKPFFLNIDHALTRNLNARSTPLPWQQSDHRPLYIEY